jgi:hypothetical protein
VLVAGGLGFIGRAIASVEVLDPAAMTWTALQPMTTPRAQFALARLTDGRLLAAGGSNYGSGYLLSAELIDPTCVPTTCALAGKQCGSAGDGCGGTLDCGGCATGQVCAANLCCQPAAACPTGACGTMADGCGATLECGSCASGQVCAANACCTPVACPAGACGTVADGCGGTLPCGSCGAGQSCVANACVATPGVAAYDAELRVPRCAAEGPLCDSGTLLLGRAGLGPEPGAPNTIASSCADGASGAFHVDESIDRIRVSSIDGGPLTAGRTARIEVTVWAYSGYSSDKLDLYVAADAQKPAWTFLATLSPTAAGAQTLSATYTLPAGGNQAVRVSFRYGGNPAPCTTGGFDDHDDLAFAVVTPIDTTPPSATITSPAPGASLSGTVAVAVAAADDLGVVRVDLYDGSSLVGTASAAPWTISWNTAAVAAGAHTLTARATDAASNVGTSAPVVVNVVAAPVGVVQAVYDATRRAPACAIRGSGCDTGGLVAGRATKGPEQNAPNTIGATCADGTAGTYHSDESIDRVKVATTSGAALAPGVTVRVEVTVWAYSTTDRLDVWFAPDAASPAWVLAGTVAPAASGAQTLSLSYVLPPGAAQQAVRASFRYGGPAVPCTTGSFDDHDDLLFPTR